MLRRQQWEQILPLALHVNAAMNAAYAKLRRSAYACLCVRLKGDFCSHADEVSAVS